MHSLKEFGIALVRIILGMVVLILGLIVLDIIVYLSLNGGSFNEKIAAAYENGYAKGYAQAYDDSYHQVYSDAYDKGYAIGLGVSSEKGLATRVELRNPTHKELKEFLARDKTNTKPYVTGEYVSFDFAVELNNNAELEGIRAAFVTVVFPKKSHGIVAFKTADKGLIYIEPQSDDEVDVVVGEHYWRSASGSNLVSYDDTIVEIQVLW